MVCEALESRWLLAADLHLSAEIPDGPFAAGEEVSYSFTVTNRGDDLEQVRIVDLPTESLDDVSWQQSVLNFPAQATEFTTNELGTECSEVIYTASIGSGDFNGDGLGDTVSVSYRRVQLFFGTTDGEPAQVTVAIDTEFTFDHLPYVSGIGDFDRDGFDDFVVARHAILSTPQVYIVYGHADLASQQDGVLSLAEGELRTTRITGFPESPDQSSFDGLWIETSEAGDINGDTHKDLAITFVAKERSTPTTSHILFGGTVAPGEAGATIDLQELDGNTGFSIQWNDEAPIELALAGGGDLNGDGIDDLAIATREQIHVVYGQPEIGSDGTLNPETLSADAGFSFSGIDAFDPDDQDKKEPGGQTIDIAPDVNGDGIGDLLTGKTVLFGGREWLGTSSP